MTGPAGWWHRNRKKVQKTRQMFRKAKCVVRKACDVVRKARDVVKKARGVFRSWQVLSRYWHHPDSWPAKKTQPYVWKYIALHCVSGKYNYEPVENTMLCL